MKPKERAFWFHYNKPESQRQGRNVLTLHYEGKCHFVNNIECHVALQTRHRKQQPRCVLHGHGYVQINKGMAVIRKTK